jgi:hypothetical protein
MLNNKSSVIRGAIFLSKAHFFKNQLRKFLSKPSFRASLTVIILAVSFEPAAVDCYAGPPARAKLKTF